MADDKKGLDLGAILKMARTRPMNVAMVMGKEGLALAGDARKGLDAMWREAKGAAGGGSKGGMGVCNVVGKEIQIQFAAEDYPSTLKKSFKEMLRNAGMKYKLVFISPSGAVDGDDEEDEDGEGEAAGGEAPAVAGAGGGAGDEDGARSQEDQLKADLDAEYAGFKDRIAAARAAGPAPAVKKLDGLEQMFLSELDRAPKKAMAVLSLLRKTVEALAPAGAGAPDPGAEERQASLASLAKSVDALLAEFA